MEKNKLTVIIDGNWLFMTRIFTCAKELRNDLPQAYTNLANGFMASVVTMKKRLGVVDNWIVVSDGGSWRKKLETPKGAATYKGTRVASEEYNWTRIWDTFKALQKSLKEQGVMCVNASDVEGDDWCAYWSKKLRDEGISNIIWTKDHDLMQLVNESNGAWTGWYNDKDGLYLNKSQDPVNQFMTVMTPDSIILDTLRKNVSKVTYIDPEADIILEKIFLGDGSDNIKPIIWTNMTKKGLADRVYKLPRKEVPYDIDIWDNDAVNSFIRNKLTNAKYSHLNFDTVREHFEYNRRIIVLSKNMYPPEIWEIMESTDDAYTIAPDNVQANISIDSIIPNTESEVSIDDIIDMI